MIKKILGIDEKSIVKKSNYYGYFLGLILGILMIVFGIIMFTLQYSSTFENILEHNCNNINYIQKVATETNDTKLFNSASLYKTNIDLIDEFPKQTGLFFIFLGLILIVNFLLYKELRNKSINNNANLTNSEEKK